MKNLIEAKTLYENRKNIILVDASGNFLDKAEGKIKYAKEHIPGAFHMDLDEDLCGAQGLHGGRNPLPQNMADFARRLENIGIGQDSSIVVYDEGAMYSSRFWWMCKYIGLQDVKVLNGGLKAWKAAGYETTTDLPTLPEKKGKIQIQLQDQRRADIQDIRRIIADKSGKSAIIDSRSNERWRGAEDNIDPKWGHIPGSLNYYYGNVLDENEKYKDPDFLKEHYRALDQYDELIFHCGSGVSGSINIIALEEIGRSSKFYVGSWSDYITYEDAIIVVEE